MVDARFALALLFQKLQSTLVSSVCVKLRTAGTDFAYSMVFRNVSVRYSTTGRFLYFDVLVLCSVSVPWKKGLIHDRILLMERRTDTPPID